MTKHLSRRELLAATATTSTVALSGCLSTLPIDQPSGLIQGPTQTKIGAPLQIQLRDFDSNSTVTLEATATDARGTTYKKYWSLRRTGKEGLHSQTVRRTTTNLGQPGTGRTRSSCHKSLESRHAPSADGGNEWRRKTRKFRRWRPEYH